MEREGGGPGYPPAAGGLPPSGSYGAAGYGYGAGWAGGEAPPSSAGGPQRPTNFHTMSLGLLVLLPALIFVLISFAVALLYHQLPGLCLSLDAVCVGLSVMFMVVRPTREGPKYWFNLGSLCFLATLAANVAGLWNFYRHFALYWAYEGQREYTNVLPGEPALSHLDAGRIFFSEDARVDAASAVGYTDEQRYCVAPILGSLPSPQIEYWAAGVNCCSERGSFSCDDVAKKQAHAGLVFLDYGPRRAELPMFRRAAETAGAASGMVPSQDALFVTWVEDPEEAQRWYRKAGTAFLLGGGLIYLGISAVVGLMLHFGRRAPAYGKGKM